MNTNLLTNYKPDNYDGPSDDELKEIEKELKKLLD